MTTRTRPDEDARRRFWIVHMERSHRLLQAMTEYPTTESGEGFASIPDAAEGAGVEVGAFDPWQEGAGPGGATAAVLALASFRGRPSPEGCGTPLPPHGGRAAWQHPLSTEIG